MKRVEGKIFALQLSEHFSTGEQSIALSMEDDGNWKTVCAFSLFWLKDLKLVVDTIFAGYGPEISRIEKEVTDAIKEDK